MRTIFLSGGTSPEDMCTLQSNSCKGLLPEGGTAVGRHEHVVLGKVSNNCL